MTNDDLHLIPDDRLPHWPENTPTLDDVEFAILGAIADIRSEVDGWEVWGHVEHLGDSLTSFSDCAGGCYSWATKMVRNLEDALTFWFDDQEQLVHGLNEFKDYIRDKLDDLLGDVRSERRYHGDEYPQPTMED